MSVKATATEMLKKENNLLHAKAISEQTIVVAL